MGIARSLSSPGPLHAVEIAARRVTVVVLQQDGGRAAVAASATEPLPPGVLTPGLAHPNIRDAEAVDDALARALDRAGGRPKRVGLVIPDAAARVSIVRFETVPARPHDLDELVKWQVGKGAPFRIDEGQLSYVPGAAVGTGGREFVVLLVRRDVVEEYESVCARLGMHAGVVDIASFNVVNAVLASGHIGGGTDWLLVHVTPEDTTLAIVRAGDLIFFRNRPAAEGSLEDLVHQTAMYYEDRLGGGGLARVIVAGGADSGDAVRRALEDRLGVSVEPVDPRDAAGLRDRVSAGAEVLDAIAAPVGLLVR
ncbi:MAG: type IV pilus biogenesis protein PilM, partial [Vicinamibacterales bacterium]